MVGRIKQVAVAALGGDPDTGDSFQIFQYIVLGVEIVGEFEITGCEFGIQCGVVHRVIVVLRDLARFIVRRIIGVHVCIFTEITVRRIVGTIGGDTHDIAE